MESTIVLTDVRIVSSLILGMKTVKKRVTSQTKRSLHDIAIIRASSLDNSARLSSLMDVMRIRNIRRPLLLQPPETNTPECAPLIAEVHPVLRSCAPTVNVANSSQRQCALLDVACKDSMDIIHAK